MNKCIFDFYQFLNDLLLLHFSQSGENLNSVKVKAEAHWGLLFCFVFFMITVEKIERTVQIEASTVEIEERGVKLRLTVVDTPGYGDAINSQDW